MSHVDARRESDPETGRGETRVRGAFLKSPLASGCALAVTMLVAQSAAAQPAKPTRAEAVFREGREAIERGDRKTGCAKIAESVRLARAAGPLLNLADCEENDGHLVAALALWKEGLRALEPSDDRRPYAKERASKLEAKLPKLTVRVVPEAPGARVEIDGEAVPLDEARAARPVDPGEHTILVKADGQSGRAEITLALGEQREATVTLSPEGREARSDKPSSGMRTAAFIAGGVGVLGVAAFGVTAGILQGHRGTVANACDARKQCTAEGLDAVEAGKAILPINTAALIVGAIGLTAGVTLFVLSPSNRDATGASASVRVDGAPDRLSASVVGVF